MALSITELKKGAIFQQNGVPYRVLEYSHKMMGRGSSTVSVKVRSLLDGKVLDKTFRGNENINSADITNKPVQYLYNDGTQYYFMDTANYEQLSVPAKVMEDKSGYIREGDHVTAQLFNSQIINIDLPKNVDLTVSYTEAAVKGNTSSAITKNATLDTGLTVKVPAFIKQGDVISVDTTSGAYRERKKG
jgi:elongation factor P